MMYEKQSKITVSVRLEEELYNILVTLAESEHRSLAQTLRYLIEKAGEDA